MVKRTSKHMYDEDQDEMREYGPEYHKDPIPDSDEEEDEEELGLEQRSMGRTIFQAMNHQNQNYFGEFAYMFEGNIPNPGIYCNKFGYLGLPANKRMIEDLKETMKDSPFGNMTTHETVVDKSVRNTLEIDAHQLTLENSVAWKGFMDKQLTLLQQKFALPQTTEIHANLYKLLLYEPNGFFKKHKDTEKEVGMFATMVVVLPSAFTGGDVIVEHNDKKMTFQPSINSTTVDKATVIAWYTDIDHEVTPVISGYRLCLVYNVIAKGTDSGLLSSSSNGSPKHAKIEKLPHAPVKIESSKVVDTIADLLRNYTKQNPDWNFVYLFDHMYSQAGLDSFGLKQRDKVAEVMLKDAIEKADCGVVMERVKIDVSGSYADMGGIRKESDFEMFDHSCIAVSERKGKVGFDRCAVLQPVNTERLGRLIGGGYTGNEEGNYEQTYHGTGLLLYIDLKMRQVFLEKISISQTDADKALKDLTEMEEEKLWELPIHKIIDPMDDYLRSRPNSWNQNLLGKSFADRDDLVVKLNEKMIMCDEKTIRGYEHGSLKNDSLFDFLMKLNEPKYIASLKPTFTYVANEYRKIASAEIPEHTDYSKWESFVNDPKLKQFLNDPLQSVLHLTLNKSERLDLLELINKHGIDLSHVTTERKGRGKAAVATMILSKQDSIHKNAMKKKEASEKQVAKLDEKMSIGETYVHMFVESSCIKDEVETMDFELKDETNNACSDEYPIICPLIKEETVGSCVKHEIKEETITSK